MTALSDDYSHKGYICKNILGYLLYCSLLWYPEDLPVWPALSIEEMDISAYKKLLSICLSIGTCQSGYGVISKKL